MDNKKRALDEDALLYKQHSDKANKESLKQMSKSEKFQYFKDYYLRKVIVCLVIIVVATYFFNLTVINKKTNILGMALTGGIDIIDNDGVQEELRKLLGVTKEKEVIEIKLLTYNDQRLMDLIGSDSIQLLITSKDEFEYLSEIGALQDLTEVLNEDEYNLLKDKFATGKVVEVDGKGEVESIGKELPYAIKVGGNLLLKGKITSEEDIYIAIIIDGSNMDNAIKTLMYLAK